MKKKMVTAVLASTLLLSGMLAGCGSDGNGSGKDGQVTLNVWGMGEEAKSLPKIAEAFEKDNPDIDVKVQALPWDTAHDKLLTAVASKKGPDVLQMGTTWIPEFASAKALLDLKPHQEKYPELKNDNFYEGTLNTAAYEGAVVGVPWYIDTRVLYYRTDLLESVGYKQAPKTWEELSDAAQKLAKRGKGKYGISLDAKEQSLGFMFARQNGSKLIDGGKPQFNQPEFVEAIEYLNSFYTNGSAPKDLGLDIVQGFKGDAILPMFISGPWMVKLINDQAPELKGKWATAVLPMKKNNISALGGSNLSIFQHSKNQEEALKFLAYMSKPETQAEWFKLTQSMPSTKKAWEDPALKDDANFRVFGQQLEASEPMPLIKPWEKIAQSYLQTFEKIYRGTGDVKPELDAFNKQAEQILN
ncbi:sugar ABC transporter substrate-binding protein [Paenibacillus gansuensis]|uniref:Sugar ABC transporter substrate-binding protein n=1 Tax=Paenibacillus gansuensis TaxID=306542 RepID=A0ABW5PKN2_9BACL